jgi:hypothetical protein
MGLYFPVFRLRASSSSFSSRITLSLLLARWDQPERLRPDSPEASEAAQPRPALPMRDTVVRLPIPWKPLAAPRRMLLLHGVYHVLRHAIP